MMSVLLVSVGMSAQGPAPKGKSKSNITVSVGGLNCSASAGADAFDVSAWSWGASNPVELFGGGGGAGKASVSSLNVMKAFDACSPLLFGAVVIGKSFPSLTLTQVGTDGSATTVSLTNVRVESWQASGTTGSDAASESVSFAFAKVCLTDGASGGKFCFDLQANKVF
jgi:type VI secretion system secreted protein Hcp